MGSIKRKEDFNSSIKNGSSQIPLPCPPLPQTDPLSESYYSQADVIQSTEERITIDTRLCSPVGQPMDLIDDYDIPKPSEASLSHNGYCNSSSPLVDSPPLAPPPPPQQDHPYYSLPAEPVQFIYDNPDDTVPSAQDPEVIMDVYDQIVLKEQDSGGAISSHYDDPIMDGYDKIMLKKQESGGAISSHYDDPIMDGYDKIVLKKQENSSHKDDPIIYAYVPTSEQRVLNWRYEIPADQEYDKLKFFVENNTFWKPAATTSDLYEQLASYKYREVHRKDIIINQTLGEGQFGLVSKGLWTSPDGRHHVAVKMLKPEATEEDRIKILQEAAIMGQFSHRNIVKLHGVVTVGEPVMMLLELMLRGDLRTYLRSIRSKVNKMSSLGALPKLLLKFCRDVASGMCYLSDKLFVHRDLAARNILLSSDLTCKIGDFGMARDLMEDENNYYKSSGGIIPLKWTAPEALNFKKYTSSSDIWSYGMVLYEIWSLGNKPFNDLSNFIVIALVNSKHCQAPPPGCSRAVYQIMVDCWNPEYSLRPKFEHIIDNLKASDESLLHWSKEDLSLGKRVHLLGGPLEESADLYIELQRTYQMAMLEQSGKNKT